MTDRSLSDIAQKMRGIDIAMLSTDAGDGGVASRPMSNNGEVDYDGDSYYFTYDQSKTVADIDRNPQVGLSFDGGDGFYLAVAGNAELIRDKAEFEAHWTPDLDKWFEQGIDTPGMVLVRVAAERIKFWDGEDGGDVAVH